MLHVHQGLRKYEENLSVRWYTEVIGCKSPDDMMAVNGAKCIKCLYKLVTLMQMLKNSQSMMREADGLFKRMNNVKLMGTLLILNEVLPHYNTLSKVFQKSKIYYFAIKPSLELTKKRITEIRSNCKPLHVLKESLKGQYKDLELSLYPLQEVLVNLCQSYISALKENLDRCFTRAAPVLSTFNIFSPTTLALPLFPSLWNMWPVGRF